MFNVPFRFITSMEPHVKEKDIPARYIMTFLGFFGLVNLYAMRTNLSLTILAMASVDDPSSNSSYFKACEELISRSTVNSSRLKEEVMERFDWDTQTQTLVLGSYYYGYVITQIPGGIMVEKVGAKWLFGIGVLATSILTLLTPLAARMGILSIISVRVIQGLGEGATFPAIYSLIGKWIPSCERSQLGAIIFTGMQMGTAFAMLVSGMLGVSTFLGGWPSVFYAFGLLGCVWFVLWSFFVYETPFEHPRISDSELTYIKQNQEQPTNIGPIPWKSILTSVPVWSLALTHFGYTWGFYTLLTEMPTYLNTILHFDLKKNGMLSTIPYIVQAMVAWLSGFLADKLRSRGNLKVTTIRKIFNSIGFFGSGLLLLSVVFVGCRPNEIVAILCATVGFGGFSYSGFCVTHVDMSPKYAGILMGITNTVANLSGFLAPAVVGWVVANENTRANWGTVFILSSVMYFVTGLVYNVFCTAKTQTWGI